MLYYDSIFSSSSRIGCTASILGFKFLDFAIDVIAFQSTTKWEFTVNVIDNMSRRLSISDPDSKL